MISKIESQLRREPLFFARIIIPYSKLSQHVDDARNLVSRQAIAKPVEYDECGVGPF
jgi:hypothetical protein